MTFLDDITPVILTRNEAPNIGRTLQALTWARRIVVVDSHSDDETVVVASRWPQVQVFHRHFDSHAAQWQFAVHDTGVTTNWVLALDADYCLTDTLVTEIAGLVPGGDVAGYRTRFIYAIHGRQLRASAYPPVVTLFRRRGAHYIQDGHTQRVVLDGRTELLRGHIVHDDRKLLHDWLAAQTRYARLEADKLAEQTWAQSSWKDRLRKTGIFGPVVIALYCLFWKAAVLDGRAGLFYTLQRVYSETLISLQLLDPRRPVDEQLTAMGARKHTRPTVF